MRVTRRQLRSIITRLIIESIDEPDDPSKRNLFGLQRQPEEKEELESLPFKDDDEDQWSALSELLGQMHPSELDSFIDVSSDEAIDQLLSATDAAGAKLEDMTGTSASRRGFIQNVAATLASVWMGSKVLPGIDTLIDELRMFIGVAPARTTDKAYSLIHSEGGNQTSLDTDSVDDLIAKTEHLTKNNVTWEVRANDTGDILTSFAADRTKSDAQIEALWEEWYSLDKPLLDQMKFSDPEEQNWIGYKDPAEVKRLEAQKNRAQVEILRIKKEVMGADNFDRLSDNRPYRGDEDPDHGYDWYDRPYSTPRSEWPDDPGYHGEPVTY